MGTVTELITLQENPSSPLEGSRSDAERPVARRPDREGWGVRRLTVRPAHTSHSVSKRTCPGGITVIQLRLTGTPSGISRQCNLLSCWAPGWSASPLRCICGGAGSTSFSSTGVAPARRRATAMRASSSPRPSSRRRCRAMFSRSPGSRSGSPTTCATVWRPCRNTRVHWRSTGGIPPRNAIRRSRNTMRRSSNTRSPSIRR